MARSFHSVYGGVTKVFCKSELLMVAHSKICDVSVIPDFADDAVLVRTLIEYAQQHAQARLVLFAASEEYVHRILSVRDELSQYYIIPYAQKDLGLRISDKPQFYAMCEQYNLPYPRTTVVTRECYNEIDSMDFPYGYPVIIKPSESTNYFNTRFIGKEKAFIIHNRHEYQSTLRTVFDSQYAYPMLVQKYVSGPVSNEYVINMYVDR
ncbi:hypothetical protein [Alloscardovia sp. HMSC034E08]|uniref:hypothetical protein n=1 Tax=Alloscardovia sp. HMSC034E08 TaxID=1739413 RepID=UPI0011D09E91|nr:hypothetical protein [Alloscardovia sp. HMSC034E08]